MTMNLREQTKYEFMNPPSESAPIEATPESRDNWWSRLKKTLGPLAVVGVVIAKFFAKLKFFFLPALKLLQLLFKFGVTILLMIWVYTIIWGCNFAVCFMIIFVIYLFNNF